MNFAVPSLIKVNLDNQVDSYGNHITYFPNQVINLNQVSSFFVTVQPSQKFTGIAGDNSYRFGIQFILINNGVIDWYFNSESERDENYNLLINSFKK